MPSPNFDTISSPSGKNPYDSRKNTKRAAKDFALKNSNIYKSFKNPEDFNQQVLKAAENKQLGDEENSYNTNSQENLNQNIKENSQNPYYEDPYNYYSDNNSGYSNNYSPTSDENNFEQEEGQSPEEIEQQTNDEPAIGEDAEAEYLKNLNEIKADFQNISGGNNDEQLEKDETAWNSKTRSALAKNAEKAAVKKAAKSTAKKAVARAAATNPVVWIVIGVVAILICLLFFFAIAYNNPGKKGDDAKKTDSTIPITGDYAEMRDELISMADAGSLQLWTEARNDISNNVLDEETLKTLLSIAKYLETKGKALIVTSIKSGRSSQTSTNSHESGHGFDIDYSNGVDRLLLGDGTNEGYLTGNKDSLNVGELIYNSSRLDESGNIPWYKYNIWDNEYTQSAYSQELTVRGHSNHIHIAIGLHNSSGEYE